MKKITLIPSFLVLIGLVLYTVTIRGHAGNPLSIELNQSFWQEQGPLELSPERGRFALTYSLVEDRSFYLSLPLAQFSTPDLGFRNNNFVSLFPPGVSFIAAGGYLLGKLLGSTQLFTYAVVSLFAIFNGLLIYLISRLLGAKTFAGALAALVFNFATPAFAYATTLYQHHISTFLILLSLYLLLRVDKFWALAVTWFLIAFSIPVDYPNLFLMLPLGLLALSKTFSFLKTASGIKISIYPLTLFASLTIVLPLFFLLWFNQNSYGNAFQYSGTVENIRSLDSVGTPLAVAPADQRPPEKNFNNNHSSRSAIGFFETRNLLNGFYILLISPDRGVIVFAPILLLAVFAFFLGRQYLKPEMSIILAVVGMNVLLYSMWADPWGGWAFGARYLIPSYAMLSILLSLVITKFRKNLLFLFLFSLVFAYSVGVNSLGALTSISNPPRNDILALEAVTKQTERYSFDRNWNSLLKGEVKSFVYTQALSRNLSPIQYYLILTCLISAVGLVFLGFSYRYEK